MLVHPDGQVWRPPSCVTGYFRNEKCRLLRKGYYEFFALDWPLAGRFRTPIFVCAEHKNTPVPTQSPTSTATDMDSTETCDEPDGYHITQFHGFCQVLGLFVCRTHELFRRTFPPT